ncbi:MAG: TraR/DksA C4-type zinc finger protein [Actinobacteria bacterium]|nr:TraR/DksA C4-type zinc finger protein [Actinomycetota bacterium]
MAGGRAVSATRRSGSASPTTRPAAAKKAPAAAKSPVKSAGKKAAVKAPAAKAVKPAPAAKAVKPASAAKAVKPAPAAKAVKPAPAAASRTAVTKTAARAVATSPGKKAVAKAARPTPATEPAATKAPAAKTTTAAPPKAAVAKAAVAKAAVAKASGVAADEPRPTPKSDWSPAELAEVRESLVAQLAEMQTEYERSIHDLTDLQTSSTDGAGDDQADAGSKTFEREQELSIVGNRLDLLTQIQRAVARIDAGTYGQCESCGNPIPKARLRAFPMATLDVACKQREERR